MRFARARGALPGIAAALVAMAAASPPLTAPFVYDDRHYVVENADLRGGLDRIPALFTVSFPSVAPERGLYRPVTALSLRLDRIGSERPAALRYHLTNLALAGALALAVHALLRRFLEPGPAAAGALLFAAHPVHVEAVAWVSGRAELLAALFAVMATSRLVDAARTADRARAAAGGAVLLAGILAKENAAAVGVLLSLWAVASRPRAPALALGAAFAATGVAAVARFAVLGTLGPSPGETVGAARWVDRLPLVLAAGGEHLRLLAWPHPLSLERMPEPPSAWSDPSVGAGALVLLAAAVLAAWAARRGVPVLFAAWPFAALLPVAHLVPIGETVAERFLLLPSVGACAVVGALLGRSGAARGMRHTAVAVLVAAGLAASIARAAVWRDEVALWDDAVRRAPGSAVAHGALGDALAAAGRTEEAAREWQAALDRDPALTAARLAWAAELARRGRPVEALEETEAAVRWRPENPVGWNHLGARLMGAGRADDAEAAFRRAVELSPRYGAALRNLGAAALEGGRPDEALALLQRAREVDPGLGGLDELATRAAALRGRGVPR